MDSKRPNTATADPGRRHGRAYNQKSTARRFLPPQRPRKVSQSNTVCAGGPWRVQRKKVDSVRIEKLLKCSNSPWPPTNQRSRVLSRAPPFRTMTPQRGGADTAADCAQWCPAGSCPPVQLSRSNCRHLAATEPRPSGESRCRTKTSFAFERGGLTPTGAIVCVCGCAQRLRRRAQESHGFKRGALPLTARDHYIFRKQHI